LRGPGRARSGGDAEQAPAGQARGQAAHRGEQNASLPGRSGAGPASHDRSGADTGKNRDQYNSQRPDRAGEPEAEYAGGFRPGRLYHRSLAGPGGHRYRCGTRPDDRLDRQRSGHRLPCPTHQDNRTATGDVLVDQAQHRHAVGVRQLVHVVEHGKNDTCCEQLSQGCVTAPVEQAWVLPRQAPGDPVLQ
jgi:hypothetical protein